jgi:hypothetical protein
MIHLKLFEAFVQKLDEIQYSDHWKERTAYINEPNYNLSRIMPYSQNFRSGFVVEKFVDGRGKEYSVSEAEEILGINPEQIQNYITVAIRNLTRSRRLERWRSDNTSLKYLMLGLGRICFHKDENTKLYPYIKGGDGKGGFYDGGDMVWGLTRNNDEGVTVKYYPSTEEGTLLMSIANEYSTTKTDKISALAYSNSSSIEYPYGKGFKMIVDLTDNDPREIENKLRNQAEGHEWTYGPRVYVQAAPVRDAMPRYATQEVESKYNRKSISKGTIVGIYNNDKGKMVIYEIATDPLNGDAIYEAYKKSKEEGNNDFRYIPVEYRGYVSSVRVTIDPRTGRRYEKYSRVGSVTVPIKLSPEDMTWWGRYKFITSEPKILAKGLVQLAIDADDHNIEE